MKMIAVLKDITRGGYGLELLQAGSLVGYVKTSFRSNIPGLGYLKSSPIGNHLEVEVKIGRTKYRVLKIIGPLPRNNSHR